MTTLNEIIREHIQSYREYRYLTKDEREIFDKNIWGLMDLFEEIPTRKEVWDEIDKILSKWESG